MDPDKGESSDSRGEPKAGVQRIDIDGYTDLPWKKKSRRWKRQCLKANQKDYQRILRFDVK